ncbi:uncharacterized protein LOC114789094 [Denticeps clupeoides]|uniref:uncharacterized protein LOC114789094 n=1 Tax=Denticeps clupeoides TaxID=299321 RepID=UPI0010A5444F|nr:uncharacterized protein LOC114789094 [Denticeps clupeoides]
MMGKMVSEGSFISLLEVKIPYCVRRAFLCRGETQLHAHAHQNGRTRRQPVDFSTMDSGSLVGWIVVFAVSELCQAEVPSTELPIPPGQDETPFPSFSAAEMAVKASIEKAVKDAIEHSVGVEAQDQEVTEKKPSATEETLGMDEADPEGQDPLEEGSEVKETKSRSTAEVEVSMEKPGGDEAIEEDAEERWGAVATTASWEVKGGEGGTWVDVVRGGDAVAVSEDGGDGEELGLLLNEAETREERGEVPDGDTAAPSQGETQLVMPGPHGAQSSDSTEENVERTKGGEEEEADQQTGAEGGAGPQDGEEGARASQIPEHSRTEDEGIVVGEEVMPVMSHGLIGSPYDNVMDAEMATEINHANEIITSHEHLLLNSDDDQALPTLRNNLDQRTASPLEGLEEEVEDEDEEDIEGDLNELVEPNKPSENSTGGHDAWKIGAIAAAFFLVLQTVVTIVYILKCRKRPHRSTAPLRLYEEGGVSANSRASNNMSVTSPPEDGVIQQIAVNDTSDLTHAQQEETVMELKPGSAEEKMTCEESSHDVRTSVL